MDTSEQTDGRCGVATEYATSDLYRAGFLLAHGREVIDVRKATPERALFVFELLPEIVALLKSYDDPDVTVRAHDFKAAIVWLKREMYMVVPVCVRTP